MEFILPDPYYDSEQWEAGKWAAEVQRQLAEVDVGATAQDTDVGHGADCPSVLAEIFKSVDWSILAVATSLGTLFLSGKRINENLDAWLEIAEKLEKIFHQLRPSKIDEYGAMLAVLKELHELGELTDAEVSIPVQALEFTLVPWGKGNLGKRPGALYIVTVNTTETLHVHGVKSSGRVEFRHQFRTGWFDFET